MSDLLSILQGDALSMLRTLETGSVQCVVTSPPYWGLRDYGVKAQIGMEPSTEGYVSSLVLAFREVRRVLKDNGTLWLNLGDSYAGSPCGSFNGGGFKDKSAQTGGRDMSGVETSGVINKLLGSGVKPKDLVGIPWMVAFALRADGWYLRSDIIWNKPNPRPESVTDRPTKSHEYLFLLSQSARYFYDADAIAEPFMEGSAERYEYLFGGKKSEALRDANITGIGQRTRIVGARTPRIPDSYKGSLPGRSDGPGQDRRSLKDRLPRKNDDTSHGSNGSKIKDHVGNSLNRPDGLRNKRSVWTVTTQPYTEAHFATYPPDLIKPCILAGSKTGDVILDPFAGSGTTGMVALELGRKATLIELNPEYVKLIKQRCSVTPGLALA